MRTFARLGAIAAGGVLAIGIVAPAWAQDPPGNNGTVKIQEVDVDDIDDGDISNDPHVPCEFQVSFFGFDEGQDATITFTIHPPSSDTGDVLATEVVVAKVGDEDQSYPFDGSTFGLENYLRHPEQGYHVKLTIDSEGVPSGTKHKVFWLDCEEPTPTPTPTPGPSEEPTPGPSEEPSEPGEEPSKPGEEKPGLPVTGVQVGGLVALGVALLGGGAAMLVVRRRRDLAGLTEE